MNLADECQEWDGSLGRANYGRLTINGERRLAHRVAWEDVHGPIPDGMVVCHRCDNPPCVNVDHLFIGTQGDNVRDAWSKGRLPPPPRSTCVGESHGAAKLTEEQVKDMRSLFASGMSRKDIANRFSVAVGLVTLIVTRRRWRHI